MSLINEALRRADAENGPRRPAPLPPPAPARPGRHTLAPQPAAALPREGGRWRTLQAVVLGGAFVVVVVAGVVIWKMVGVSPAAADAAPALSATLS
ncbi:MAG: hypothetical protein NT049_09800 [Planctomycetota bacterium]|nr:hypothetical protein [Planctomycetota bacterium]